MRGSMDEGCVSRGGLLSLMLTFASIPMANYDSKQETGPF